MKKYIVLSVNQNEDYAYFVPLVCWAWRKFGWDPILFYLGGRPDYIDLSISEESPIYLDPIKGYRSDTITQISRLYACQVKGIDKLDYLMTGDIDMLPLSNYWNPDDSNITVWGHDLTGFGHYPICYIGMPAAHWHRVMMLHDFDFNASINRDLDTLPQAKDPDFYKYWFSDQDLITERLKPYGDKIMINRGQGKHGYAYGRVDRGNGGWVLDQPQLIDAHLEQQTHHSTAKIERLYALLAYVWPGEDFTWFKKYTEEFRIITGHHG